ncbi:MAG: phenylacetate--CoA ligase family protein, partial [Candidatus Dormibacteraceae bacterium]
YRIGDYVAVATESCGCGRTHARAVGGPIGRSDDMLKVHGVVIFPSDVEALVRRVRELSNEFMLILTSAPHGGEELTIQVEPVPGVPEAEFTTLKHRMANDVRVGLGIRAELQVLPAGTLPRAEFKSQRVRVERSAP